MCSTFFGGLGYSPPCQEYVSSQLVAAEKAGSLPLQEGELRATSEPSNATSSGVYRVGSVNKRHRGVQCRSCGSPRGVCQDLR